MRHGQAEPVAATDQQRELTEQGKLEAALMGKWLAKHQVTFDQVFVSPYVRAQQTAKELLAQLNGDLIWNTLELITPSGDAQMVHDYLDGTQAIEHFNRILLVSHMPIVSYLVAELTVEHDSPIFQTAAIAQIDYDIKRMKGHLVSITSPYDLC